MEHIYTTSENDQLSDAVVKYSPLKASENAKF